MAQQEFWHGSCFEPFLQSSGAKLEPMRMGHKHILCLLLAVNMVVAIVCPFWGVSLSTCKNRFSLTAQFSYVPCPVTLV